MFIYARNYVVKRTTARGDPSRIKVSVLRGDGDSLSQWYVSFGSRVSERMTVGKWNGTVRDGTARNYVGKRWGVRQTVPKGTVRN